MATETKWTGQWFATREEALAFIRQHGITCYEITKKRKGGYVLDYKPAAR